MSIVVTKRTTRPQRKSTSAPRSIFVARAVLLRMAMKDDKQLLMKIMIAKAAPSSMIEDSSSFEILTDVSTIKQKPSKLADVFKIWGDLFSFTTDYYDDKIIGYKNT